MATEALGEVRQAIVIGLGGVGSGVLTCLERRLMERHKGIPTIRLMALDVREGPEDQYQDRGEIRRLDLSFDLDELLEARQSSISRWLPDEMVGLARRKQDVMNTRLWGRLALFRHADRVHVEVREATDSLLNVVTRSKLESRGLRVKDESSLDVYIIGALDEPLASGALIDLAYLVAHTVDYEVSVRVFSQTTGILFLPSFSTWEDLDGLSSEEISAQRDVEMMRDADAYAFLKELDYYMDKRRYQAAYSAGLTFSQNTRPFTQSCYLVDARNERNKGMPSLDQMVEMVGEWLYQMLASPLKDGFQMSGVPFADHRSHGKVATYSGLGLAAFFLPINDIIELCSSRQAAEMIGDYFLRPASEEDGVPPADFGVQSQDVQDRLQDDSTWSTKRAQYISVPLQHFAHIAPHDLGRLEGQLRRTFDYRLKQMLPRLRQGMQLNLEEMIQDFQDRLAGKVAQRINSSPAGGISLVRRYLHQQKRDLATDEARVRNELSARSGERQAAENRIRSDRANHIAAVRTFSSRWAIAGLVSSVIATLVLLYYALLTFLDTLGRITALGFSRASTIAAIVALAGTLLALGAAAFIGYDWWRRTYHSYIEAHRRRLALALEIELREVEAQYYRRAQHVVDQQIVEVMDFQGRLEDLQAGFAADVNASRPLYSSPRFAIEESVVDEKDVDRFYAELVGETLEDEILALFADCGPFYAWRDAADREIVAALRAFGHKKFDILRRTKSAEGLLIEHAAKAETSPSGRFPDRLAATDLDGPGDKRGTRRRLEELRDNSMPFLRYSDLELDEGISTNLVHYIGFDGARNVESLVYQILEEQHISKMYTGDRHRITSMAARHGLSLASIGVLRRWRKQYEALRGTDSRQLHTQRSHMALPDVFPLGEDVLQPQMVVAMGIVYDCLQQREDDGHYAFEYEDDLGEMVQADLGADKLDACVYLQDAPAILRILSEWIEQETERRSEEVDEEGARKGNRGLIRDLRLHRRRKREQGALENWEEIMIDEYILRLER